jgi:hypothetical protein
MWNVLLHAASITLLLQAPLFAVAVVVGVRYWVSDRPMHDAPWIESSGMTFALVAAGLWLLATPVFFMIDEGSFTTYDPIFDALGPGLYVLISTLIMWELTLLLAFVIRDSRRLADVLVLPAFVVGLLAAGVVMTLVLGIPYVLFDWIFN